MAKQRSRNPRQHNPASRTEPRTQQQAGAFARCLVLAKSLRSRMGALTERDRARVLDFIENGTLVPD